MVTVDIRGESVSFDEIDRPIFEAHRWWVTNRGYVLTKVRDDNGKRRSIGLHRIILGDPAEDIDHIDRNPRNNTRANLRACGKAVNNKNVPTRIEKSSAFRGVSKRGDRWQVVVRINGKLTWLGVFDTETEAAQVAAPHFEGIAA